MSQSGTSQEVTSKGTFKDKSEYPDNVKIGYLN